MARRLFSTASRVGRTAKVRSDWSGLPTAAYGTTGFGGNGACSFGCGTVFKLDPHGHEITLHSFTGGADGAYPNVVLVRDSAGNLYGTTGGGGDPNCGCGTVFKITP
jgi:uncharacterized repeat protein (TIGR03803 family)